VAGSGGVVAGIAGNEGIGAGSNGHLEKGRVVWIGHVGLQGKGSYRLTLCLDLIQEGSNPVGGEREFGAGQYFSVFRKNPFIVCYAE